MSIDKKIKLQVGHMDIYDEKLDCVLDIGPLTDIQHDDVNDYLHELMNRWNMHDELLAQLKKATDALAGGLWDYGPDQDEHDKCDEIISECRALIAKIEEMK